MSGGFTEAARVRAGEHARAREWTARNLRKAGLRGLMMVSGYDAAAEYIHRGEMVVIDQQGEDYLFAILTNDEK